MNSIFKLTIILLFFFISSYSFGQEKIEQQSNIETIEVNDSNEIFVMVDEFPEFPGGDAARIYYFRDSIDYPKLAIDSSVEGTVYVTFVIEADGRITHVELLKGIGSGCDEEALRATREMPNWIPAKKDGVKVRSQFNIPIRFVLPHEESPSNATKQLSKKEKKVLKKKQKAEAKAKKKRKKQQN